MYIVAVVPARKGSKGIPGKNARSMLGKPLFLWSVDAAKKAKIFDEIIVTTDSEHIRSLALSNGTTCPGLRPDHLSTDSALCIDAVDHAVREWASRPPDMVVILQPTSPLRSSEEIVGAISQLKQLGTAADAVVMVEHSPVPAQKCYTLQDGLMKTCYSIKTTNRQELPMSYKETGSVYCFWWSAHVSSPESTLICGLNVQRVAPMLCESPSIDIDSESDWVRCERELLQRYPAPAFEIGSRKVGADYPPLVIAEIGINHEGDINKAIQMVDDAVDAGADVVKFQCHICEDEMIPEAKKTIPGNASDSIWDIMKRCELNRDEVVHLKKYVEAKGAIYMSSPFSRAAANFLEELGVQAYKIGSGECNNYPLLEHISSFGKPIILSTGMNSIDTIQPSVDIFRTAGIPYALLHCTSLYPTPYEKVRLGCIPELQAAFPDAILGLSDHSLGNWTCFGAISIGGAIVEKHFTSDRRWVGPDIPISIDPVELEDLVKGSNIIWMARGNGKAKLTEEQITCDFAFASVVTIAPIRKGDVFSRSNIWVKRPGTGELLAKDYGSILGKKASQDVEVNAFLKEKHIENLHSD